MAINDIIQHLVHQRACRSFTDEPVSDADLATMLRAATHAPSAENAQPWVFVVVREPATQEAIADLTRAVWDGGARQHSERTLDRRSWVRSMRSSAAATAAHLCSS